MRKEDVWVISDKLMWEEETVIISVSERWWIQSSFFSICKAVETRCLDLCKRTSDKLSLISPFINVYIIIWISDCFPYELENIYFIISADNSNQWVIRRVWITIKRQFFVIVTMEKWAENLWLITKKLFFGFYSLWKKSVVITENGSIFTFFVFKTPFSISAIITISYVLHGSKTDKIP